MSQLLIKVSDFTKLPGARHRNDGDYSADEFFETKIEMPLRKIIELKNKDKILIDLDGTLGYASSFVSQMAIRILETCNNIHKIKKIIIIKSDEDPSQKEGFWNEINKR